MKYWYEKNKVPGKHASPLPQKQVEYTTYEDRPNPKGQSQQDVIDSRTNLVNNAENNWTTHTNQVNQWVKDNPNVRNTQEGEAWYQQNWPKIVAKNKRLENEYNKAFNKLEFTADSLQIANKKMNEAITLENAEKIKQMNDNAKDLF